LFVQRVPYLNAGHDWLLFCFPTVPLQSVRHSWFLCSTPRFTHLLFSHQFGCSLFCFPLFNLLPLPSFRVVSPSTVFFQNPLSQFVLRILYHLPHPLCGFLPRSVTSSSPFLFPFSSPPTTFFWFAVTPLVPLLCSLVICALFFNLAPLFFSFFSSS